MIRVRCTYCRQVWMIDNEAIAAQIQAEEKTNLKHYSVECPACRRVNKIPIIQILPRRPRKRRNSR